MSLEKTSAAQPAILVGVPSSTKLEGESMIIDVVSMVSETKSSSACCSRSRCCTFKMKIFWSVFTFFFVALAVVLGVALDAVLAQPETIEVNFVQVNANEELPTAEAEFVLLVSSTMSKFEPTGINCNIEQSGWVYADITMTAENTYILNGTISKEDSELHAALIWDVLMGQRDVGYYWCEVELSVLLGHLIPLTAYRAFDSNNYDLGISSTDPEAALAAAPAATESVNEESTKSESGTENEEGRQDRLVVVNIDETIELNVGVDMPVMAFPVHLVLPPVVISAQTNASDQAVVTFNGMDRKLDAFSYIPVSASCKGDCAWYKPLIDVVTGADGTLEITVDGNSSFLEVLLGRYHEIKVSHDTAETARSTNARRQASNISTGAKLDCLRVEGSDIALSACLNLLATSGLEAYATVGVYDFEASARADASWRSLEMGYGVEAVATAKVSIGDSDEMDLKGNAKIDWTEDVTVNVVVTNDAGAWPLEAILQGSGKIDGDVLTVNMPVATLTFQNNQMVNAIGEGVIDGDKQIFTAFILDPNLQAKMDGKLIDKRVMGSASLTFNGDDITEMELSAEVVTVEEGGNFIFDIKDKGLLDFELSGKGDLNWSENKLVGSVRDLWFRLEGTRYVDADGDLMIDMETREVSIAVVDETVDTDYSFRAQLIGAWRNDEFGFGGYMSKADFSINKKPYVASTASFSYQYPLSSDRSNILLWVESKEEAQFQVSSDMRFDWIVDTEELKTDSATVVIGYGSKTYVDAMVDVYVGIQATLVTISAVDTYDTDGQGFELKLRGSWEEDADLRVSGEVETLRVVMDGEEYLQAFGDMTVDMSDTSMSCSMEEKVSNSRILIVDAGLNVKEYVSTSGSYCDGIGEAIQYEYCANSPEWCSPGNDVYYPDGYRCAGEWEQMDVFARGVYFVFSGDRWVDGEMNFMMNFFDRLIKLAVSNDTPKLYIDTDISIDYN
ncbi:hypothetical protein SARC_12856 [Sphaeroforma arctica JP610]|uniref:Uncharacterized protein n=1 Tax=Sphaeroforma arctica JP610 TaxID=667725 RepID=A0A0L0FCX3_9EUKA|nr:hypothetical protein SARC_12856 [Sphaeroforma arctica JP610]KNC74602.1 hypothetical protein SARC_12856 [Sphaeroforma arctica JP610]|eukprot:XP_014148504.1 hypothetical protein SARC_12856 [Sphaeroforma arctica JP610]